MPIICEQKSAEKKEIKENLLRQANKNGFDNEVGGVTNRCTGMFDILATFEKGTKEYNEMEYRIICMQGYQQEVIDSVKGVVAKEVPKHWYDYNAVKINGNESEETKQWKLKQQKLLSNKKPYFFIYNYKQTMNIYKKYLKDSDTSALIKFGMTIDELKNKVNKTEEQIEFITYFDLLMPISTSNSTMNRIAWALEDKFKDINILIESEKDFDTSIMKTNHTYPKDKYIQIEELYKQYKTDVSQYIITCKNKNLNEKKELRTTFINRFREKASKICSNKYVLCNILIDMCYSNKESKQFVWDICGSTIVNNLLKKHENIIRYPIIVEDKEDFIWNGHKYKIIERNIEEGCDGFKC